MNTEKTEELLARILPRLARRQALRDELNRIHDQLVRENAIPGPPPPAPRLQVAYKRLSPWMRFSVAATVTALLVGGGWLGLRQRAHQQDTQLYASAFALPDIEMIQGAKGGGEVTSWQDAYQQQNYATAAASVEECLKANTCPPIAAVYAGACYMHLGQTTRAIAVLERVSAPGVLSPPRRNVALLYQALAWMQAHNRPKAAEVLRGYNFDIPMNETIIAKNIVALCGS